MSALHAIKDGFRDTSGEPQEWVIFNPSQGKNLPTGSEQSISDFGIRHGTALFMVPATLPEEMCSWLAGEILAGKYQQQRSCKALEDVEAEIDQVIENCKWTEENGELGKDVFGVLKCFDPRYLESFLNSRQLLISTAPGFTWGDAVYVLVQQ